MSMSLRLILLAGSLLIFGTVLNYIRKRRILMANSTGWVVMAGVLLLIALFPDAAAFLGAAPLHNSSPRSAHRAALLPNYATPWAAFLPFRYAVRVAVRYV